MKAVLLDRATLGDVHLTPIRESVSSLTCFDYSTEEEAIHRLQDADICITNKVPISEATLAQLPQLKLICVAATGTNVINLNAAQQRKVPICNIRNYAGTSIAQHVFSLLLNLTSQTHQYIQDVQHKRWSKSPIFCRLDYPMMELKGKTLGIIGYGTLGQSIEKIAHAFEMKVLIAERQHADSIRPGRISFDEVLRCADIITLHCPLTGETHHLFSENTFQKMKRTAVLINTARGDIIDHHALKIALTEHQIAGAALDVLDQEPPPEDHILLQDAIPNLLITPHIAWATQESRQRLVSQIGNIIRSFQQDVLINQVC
ncbi:D-2-hydroxyacid dehydrogenase [Algicola sagamiensis]|uniref:D-2-hydroxyacid dehydrogenase n=1 Tax=Algicola sagamiensis TaxID=163869 RepID=UPI000376C5E9|nr:D-2-hydroxyacid dehydrogenase [Algicola sagamiensis]